MLKLEQALDSIETRELKRLGSALVDRLEATKKYADFETDIDITDYLIIGEPSKPFALDLDAIERVSNHKEALVIAAIAGGMCEMSEMITKLSNLVKERQA